METAVAERILTSVLPLQSLCSRLLEALFRTSPLPENTDDDDLKSTFTASLGEESAFQFGDSCPNLNIKDSEEDLYSSAMKLGDSLRTVTSPRPDMGRSPRLVKSRSLIDCESDITTAVSPPRTRGRVEVAKVVQDEKRSLDSKITALMVRGSIMYLHHICIRTMYLMYPLFYLSP